MTESRIHVFPPNGPKPLTARLPFENSLRWFSSFEEDEELDRLYVFMQQPVYTQICSHTASDLDNEVGGILVGKWCVDDKAAQQFIILRAALPARFTQQGNVFLTFTQDSLVDIHEQIDEEYPQDVILGWYHTHPRMGVFLSNYDTWLHEHFFPEPWQAALVVEPVSQCGGFFIRNEGDEIDPSRYSGFYELMDSGGQSIVQWNNLVQKPALAGEEGAETNE